tara:strand:- start:684 stop:857 length:174 start_codon:yes stop_codon:yes gene_type:complete
MLALFKFKVKVEGILVLPKFIKRTKAWKKARPAHEVQTYPQKLILSYFGYIGGVKPY